MSRECILLGRYSVEELLVCSTVMIGAAVLDRLCLRDSVLLYEVDFVVRCAGVLRLGLLRGILVLRGRA